ncbi:MAG TPA: hypothetical protein VG324_09365, partial [Blastocatellia bacterium]|nr:hypothetical protein [Blastocatellia bacterium]
MQITLKDYKLLAFLLVVALLAVAYFDNQNASGMGVLTQARDAASNKRERKARAAAAAAEVERVLTQAKYAASDRLVWLDN